MNPELKKEWVEALRSGDYKQGQRHLCTTTESGTEKFCCLGVLCDIGLDADWLPFDAHGVKGYQIHLDRTGILSPYDRQKLGLAEGVQGLLIGMNDGGTSFAKIANWIEENVR